MSYLQLQKIAKSFGDVQVVQEMDLSAAAGEFIVLVGASGCGKSTTLRMIAGLESPTSGRILIDGRDVTAATPADRDIAMVFQNYALYPHMNVAQNMSFALELSGTSKAVIAQRVDAAAQVLNIKHLLDRKPKELSGGQRQRVAMGRAIVREPKVFLFDEPLSNLDAKLRGHMRIEIAMLHRRLGKTTVYVTHDQIEAMTLADRIVVMDQGCIQQMGIPDEVFNRPLNRFVAGFIGSPTMNFLNATVKDVEGQLRFVGTGFGCEVPESMKATAHRFIGQSVVLGIRPQAIQLGASDHGLGFSLRVNVCEYLGTESVLSCTLLDEASSVTFTAPGNHMGLINQTVPVHVPLESIYAFEPGEHGRSLGL
ncbi:ABC transporter ATP-binding protein [Verminephrobacter eiseniae]|uniref:ABC transporter ATP-binding protein n=1 Tax=Verminephrobacter eiseniae TaxID=364317 RepID=UPI00223749E0|nr:sn-glycerol-3-phosphate ABC transporter ATP-binding protein UgpC [Verminephrobacter eiseniae]MCW5232316.1 sn-glycerol-3-phosphate ABC transporter ATP-binding protein UgpC [Verminephrobacter eiseniae]MCW5296120.1 sn-glycerol-3-phosphate ABC transporter ATP-binding protein UgpC [Verminephrobacter eiseniae]MCW8186950.1 sn-glycerol-3-phosphate ABC transporter ATP-binding protein UgpC [Verminephrobacter eiseniae]MCW8225336.1 sn-glycerol-3-phosphate ABC transporter ATP-binding protein UgpC [Vermin